MMRRERALLFSLLLASGPLACSAPFGGGRGPTTCEVVAPPAEAGFDPMYESYLFCSGIPLLGTAGVDPEALRVADQTMAFMLRGAEATLERLLDQGYYYVLRGPGVKISDLPERWSGYISDDGGLVDPSIPAGTSYAHEVLCDVRPNLYFDNNVLLHELAHVMHFGGVDLQSETERRINETYASARRAGLWENTFAGLNAVEYLAELTQIWFEVGRQRGPPEGDGFRGPIVSREELQAYDPAGYELIGSMFHAGFDVPGCFQRTRATVYRDPSVSCPPSVRDGEGEDYRVVQVGRQCWMAENLRSARFRDGTEIPALSGAQAWAGARGPAACSYDDLAENVSALGRLYNHAALGSSGGLCPPATRLPRLADHHELIRAVALEARSDETASALRAQDEWASPGPDSYGFAARPTGFRRADGSFDGRGQRWSIWLADGAEDARAKAAYLVAGSAYLGDSAEELASGHSVRCIGE